MPWAMGPEIGDCAAILKPAPARSAEEDSAFAHWTSFINDDWTKCRRIVLVSTPSHDLAAEMLIVSNRWNAWALIHILKVFVMLCNHQNEQRCQTERFRQPHQIQNRRAPMLTMFQWLWEIFTNSLRVWGKPIRCFIQANFPVQRTSLRIGTSAKPSNTPREVKTRQRHHHRRNNSSTTNAHSSLPASLSEARRKLVRPDYEQIPRHSMLILTSKQLLSHKMRSIEVSLGDRFALLLSAIPIRHTFILNPRVKTALVVKATNCVHCNIGQVSQVLPVESNLWMESFSRGLAESDSLLPKSPEITGSQENSRRSIRSPRVPTGLKIEKIDHRPAWRSEVALQVVCRNFRPAFLWILTVMAMRKKERQRKKKVNPRLVGAKCSHSCDPVISVDSVL